MRREAPCRVFVTGGRGQLGRELGRWLAAWGCTHWLLDLPELDVTDRETVGRVLRELAPDLVIHAAAYTQVDLAESERERAMTVNATATEALADLCRERGVAMVYISTDFVFDGVKGAPYEPEDSTGPLNHYGLTKLRGEEAVLVSGAHAWVVRTSWLYGIGGANFPKAILRQAADGKIPRVVVDQIGSPTYARDLAYAVCALTGAAPGHAPAAPGIYHYANEGQCSWWEFAREILGRSGWLAFLPAPAPIPVESREFPRPAKRPANSVLGLEKTRAAGVPLRPWPEALEEFLGELRAIAPELFPRLA